jgi:DNA-binding NarL/FixJ family response regulator
MTTNNAFAMNQKPVPRLGVLIVDDAEEVRRDLRTVLELASDLVILGEADNGLDAVSMAEALRPDIVLMDLRMPGIDGFEATKQIKSRGLARGVIMLTIYSHEEYRLRADSVGVDLFLEKGIGIEALLTALQQVGQAILASKTGVL